MQTPKSPSGLKPMKSNLKGSTPSASLSDIQFAKPGAPADSQLGPPSPAAAVPAAFQDPTNPLGSPRGLTASSPRGLRSISMFAPDMGRADSGASNLSTEPLQQGPNSSGVDDLAGMHAKAYMEKQRKSRGTSFVDASGKSYNFKD